MNVFKRRGKLFTGPSRNWLAIHEDEEIIYVTNFLLVSKLVLLGKDLIRFRFNQKLELGQG